MRLSSLVACSKHDGLKARAVVVQCYMFRMFNILLEGKGVGWSVLRFALILGPAVLARIVLNTAFRLD